MSKKSKTKKKGGDHSGPSSDPEEELERLVVQSMAAWEAGNFDKALRLGEQACEVVPNAAVAHHCRAAALAELDRIEEAQEACDRGLELDPDDPDVLGYAADFYLACLGDEQRCLELCARGLRAAERAKDEELQADCLLLRGRAEEQLGRLPEALASVEAAMALLGNDDVDALLERAILLFELCRLDDARAQLEALTRQEPDLAAPHHYLGLIEERRGDAAAAGRHFARARELGPEEFPEPLHIPAGEFDDVVEQAMSRLPAKVRAYLKNVAVTVEDLPRDEDLCGGDPPLSPLVLGMFRGSPLGEQRLLDPWTHLPSSIVLYQKNLERSASERSELVDQIVITLLHEVGHFLGLDEDDLRERGLD